MTNSKTIEIVDFDSCYSKDFLDINIQWIKAEYYVEDYDLKVLSDPIKYIIEKGGHILFAKSDDGIVGTVALMNTGENSFELAKMAVLESHRGLKIGDELMIAAINYSKRKNIKLIWLESNRKSVPAVSLYKKHGFKETALDPNTPYDRCDVRMELYL